MFEINYSPWVPAGKVVSSGTLTFPATPAPAPKPADWRDNLTIEQGRVLNATRNVGWYESGSLADLMTALVRGLDKAHARIAELEAELESEQDGIAELATRVHDLELELEDRDDEDATDEPDSVRQAIVSFTDDFTCLNHWDLRDRLKIYEAFGLIPQAD